MPTSDRLPKLLRRALLVVAVASEPCERDRTPPPTLLPGLRAALAAEDTLWVQLGSPPLPNCTGNTLPHFGPAVFRMDRRSGRAALDTIRVRYWWDGRHLWEDDSDAPARRVGPDADRVVGPFLRELWSGLDHSVILRERGASYTVELPFGWDDGYAATVRAGRSGEPRRLTVVDRRTGRVADSPWGPLEASVSLSWRAPMPDDLDTPESLWSRRRWTGATDTWGDPTVLAPTLLPPY